MQETDDTPEGGESAGSTDISLPEHRQTFIAMVVAMTALAVVMVVMLLAIRTPQSPQIVGSNGDSRSVLPQDYSSWVTIEEHTYTVRTNVAGHREFQMDGFVRNTGAKAVCSADVRCYFRTRAGDEVAKDIPLVVDSELEEIDGGALMPFSRREFHVRVGAFPENAEPDLVRMEVINVGFCEP